VTRRSSDASLRPVEADVGFFGVFVSLGATLRVTGGIEVVGVALG
jgi:hypothetical protein